MSLASLRQIWLPALRNRTDMKRLNIYPILRLQSVRRSWGPRMKSLFVIEIACRMHCEGRQVGGGSGTISTCASNPKKGFGIRER